VSKKQALKAISLLWLGSLLGAGCAFLTQVILARQLGPAEFGAFATAFAMVTMLMPLAGFGVAQYWQRGVGGYTIFSSFIPICSYEHVNSNYSVNWMVDIWGPR
jgi:O-antigen/teichoic acid export membrane protein